MPAGYQPPTTHMSFDLDTLKDKLPGETLDKLRAHVDELSTRAETAEEKSRKAAKESIDGRKTLKATLDKAMAKLGVETAEELDALPDGKGAGEATKQLDAQIKKLTRERDEALQASEKATGELKTTRRESALSQAIEGQRFKNPADVRVLLQSRVVDEGDDLLFKTDDGKLVPLTDGAAWFAKTRPDYVEPQGAAGGGSGFKGTGGAGGSGAKTKTRAEWDSMDHSARASFAKEGGQVVETH